MDTLQEVWLTRPIDITLARERRRNQTLADEVTSVKRLQAVVRRAVDAVGPCIHLARKLLPILRRNAAVRFYKDFRDGTYAARCLHSVCLLYWYKSTEAPADLAPTQLGAAVC